MNFLGITILVLFSLSIQARNLGGIAGSPLDSEAQKNDSASKNDQPLTDKSSLGSSSEGGQSSSVESSGTLASPWSEWMKLKAPPAAFLKPKKTFPFPPSSPSLSSAEELAASSPWAEWAKLKTATAAASIPTLPVAVGSVAAAPGPGGVAPVAPWDEWAKLKTATAAASIPTLPVAVGSIAAAPGPGGVAPVAPWAAWTSLKVPSYSLDPAGLPSQVAPNAPSPAVAPWTAWAQLKTATAAENVGLSIPGSDKPTTRTIPASEVQTASVPNAPSSLEEYLKQLAGSKGSVIQDPVYPSGLSALTPQQLQTLIGQSPPSALTPDGLQHPYVLSAGGQPDSALLQEEESGLDPALLEHLKTLGIKVPETIASTELPPPGSEPPALATIPGVSPVTPGASIPSTTPTPLKAAEEKLLLKWAKKIFSMQKNSTGVPSNKTSTLEAAWKEWVTLHNNATNATTPVGEVDPNSLVTWLKEIEAFPLETKKIAELVKWIQEIEKTANSSKLQAPIPSTIPAALISSVTEILSKAPPEEQLRVAAWIAANNITVQSPASAALPVVPIPGAPSGLVTDPFAPKPIPPNVIVAVNALYPDLLPEQKLQIATWVVANNVTLPVSPGPLPVQPADVISPFSPLPETLLPSRLPVPLSIPPEVVAAVNALYPTEPVEKKLTIASWIVSNNITLPSSPLPSPDSTTSPTESIPPSVVDAVKALYPTADPKKQAEIASWIVANNVSLPTIISSPATPELSLLPPTQPTESVVSFIPPTESVPFIPSVVVDAVNAEYPTLAPEQKLQIALWILANNVTLPPGPVEFSTVTAPSVPAAFLPQPPVNEPAAMNPSIIIPEKLSPFKDEIQEILLRGPPEIKSQLITWLIANNATVSDVVIPPPPPTPSYAMPPWVSYLYPTLTPPASPYPTSQPAAPTENPLLLPLLEQLSPAELKTLLQQVLENCNKSTTSGMVTRSSNSRTSGKHRNKHHRKQKEVDNDPSSEEDVIADDAEPVDEPEAEPIVSAMRRALYPYPVRDVESEPQTTPASSKPSKLDFVPQEFWDMVPTVAPNTSLIDPGYWAAKKSMFISKLFDALARVTLNYTNSVTTTTENPKQALMRKIDTEILSNAARSVKDKDKDDDSEETSTDDEDLINSEEPANLPKEPENPLHKLFKFGVQKTILSDLSTTPAPQYQPFLVPPQTTVAPPPKTTPKVDEQKDLLKKLKSVLNHSRKSHRKSKKSKSRKFRGSTTTESPIDFEELAKALLVQPSK